MNGLLVWISLACTKCVHSKRFMSVSSLLAATNVLLVGDLIQWLFVAQEHRHTTAVKFAKLNLNKIGLV